MGQRGGLRQRPSLRSHTPVQGSLEPQGHAGSETAPRVLQKHPDLSDSDKG